MVGTVVGALVSLGISQVQISKFLRVKEKKADPKILYGDTKSSFLIMLTIFGFYSLDILVAKAVFSPDIAGAYAISSTLAKIVFLGTQPISRAMFPLTAERKKVGKRSEGIFANSFVLFLLGIFVSLVIVYFLPELIILIFAGRVIEESVMVLFYLSVGTSFLSLTNLVLLYKLSIDKISRCSWLLAFIVLEVVLLVTFSGNILEFSIAYIVSSVAFLWGSVVLVGK